MTMYSKNEAYPVTRAKFPHQIIDGGGISYTSEHAFNNRGDFGWLDASDKPVVDASSKKVTWVDGDWVVASKTEEEVASDLASAWQPVRDSRDALLFGSDWSAIKISDTEYGVPGNVVDADTSAAWQVYRQALRDITDGSPDSPDWPVSP